MQREVTPSERVLAVEWAMAFMHEAMPNHPNEAEESVDRNLRAGTLYFWDNGGPVTMYASPGGAATSARISLVYTPPDLPQTGLRNGLSVGPHKATAGRRQSVLLPLHRSRKPDLEQRLPAYWLSAGVRHRPVLVRGVVMGPGAVGHNRSHCGLSRLARKHS
jgi:hypothetical protein